MKPSSVLVGVLFTSLSIFAAQQTPCDEACGKPTPWDNFNVFAIKVAAPGQQGYQFLNGRFDNDSSDAQIDIENSDGRSTKKGKILLIGGRFIAIQGPISEEGYEIDALDGAVLQLRMVVGVLGEVLPSGPAGITVQRIVDFRNEKTGLHFATPSAEGGIAAPWSVKGSVKATDHDSFAFDLVVTSATRRNAVDSGQFTESLVGTLSKATNAKIDDSMALDGWKVLALGIQTRKQDGGTVYDYGAGSPATGYKTITDIREKIVSDDYPGELDPAKDFTGFWKEDCEQAFGLQIMHHGSDGRYTVVFCGPGGCGDSEEATKTFINKDPQYEIVSEEEIKTRAGDGWDTYHRCTKDPHPVLKFKNQ